MTISTNVWTDYHLDGEVTLETASQADGKCGVRLLAVDAETLKRRGHKRPWDADHIVPVAEGGGECDLKNMRTLRLRYRCQATAQMRVRLRGAKVRYIPGS